MAVEDLFAREADLHRAARQEGQLGDDDLVIERVALPAEAAAVRAGHDPDSRRGHAEDLGERAVEVVRRLRRGTDRQPAVGLGNREARVLLHREVRVPAEEEDVLEHVVRGGDRGVHVAELHRDPLVDVPVVSVVVERFHVVLHGLGRIEDGFELLVFDVDGLDRLEGDLLVPRSHGDDGIADEAHAIHAERVLVLRDGQDAERRRHRVARERPRRTPSIASAADVSIETIRA